MKKEKTFFGKQFKKIIFEKGFTQQDFAEQFGIDRVMISQWITGTRNPSVKSLKKLADALDVPINYFIENNNENFEIKNSLKNINNGSNNKDMELLKEKMKRYELENILLKNDVKNLKQKLENIEKNLVNKN